MIAVRTILEMYAERKKNLSITHQAALDILQAYNGEIILPLPELDQAEKPMVANLVMTGIDQKAMRVASTEPSVYFPPLRTTVDTSKDRARYRGEISRNWWKKSRMARLRQQRARHYIAYANTPVLVRPDLKRGMPRWFVRNPLETFAPPMQLDEIVPPDCIFSFSQPLSWLKRVYPDQASTLNKKPPASNFDQYQILEYTDSDEYVLAVAGESYNPPFSNPYGHTPEGEIVELERIPNRCGYPWAVVPSKVSLDQPRGEFNGVAGMLWQQAKLMALEVIGIQQAIFPTTWLVDNPGETATVLVEADPMRGISGHLTGGKLDKIGMEPSVFNTQIIDRLERAQRVEGGIPAELGGEASSNIRTGRRGEQVLGAALNFSIATAQDLLAMSNEEELRIAIEIDKAYFPQTKSFFVSETVGTVTYTPADVWEPNSDPSVRYAYSGTDQQGLVVEGGQRVAMGTMSKQTFMEIDPLVNDPESEKDKITAERIDDAFLMAMAQMAQDPTLAPVIAQQAMMIRQDKVEIPDAMVRVNRAVQERQAAAAQQMQQAQPPGPEAQPGMAEPTAVNPPAPSMENLRDVLQTLRAG